MGYLEIDDVKFKEKMQEQDNEKNLDNFLKSKGKYQLIDDPYIARYIGFGEWFRLGKVYFIGNKMNVKTNTSNFQELKILLEEFSQTNKINTKLEVIK